MAAAFERVCRTGWAKGRSASEFTAGSVSAGCVDGQQFGVPLGTGAATRRRAVEHLHAIRVKRGSKPLSLEHRTAPC